MSPEERREKIKSYARAYDRLEAALIDFPKEMWDYRPDEGEWTIHEILVHLADSEADSYVRCRRFIAEPGSEILGYNEQKWAQALHYGDQSVRDALELFRRLRSSTYCLIRDLPEGVWSNTVVHSESGRMTMDDWLTIYERHVAEHVAQMRAIYHTWRLSQTP